MSDTKVKEMPYKPAHLGKRVCAAIIDTILYIVSYIMIMMCIMPIEFTNNEYEYEDDVCDFNLSIPQTLFEYMVAVLLPIVFYMFCFIHWGTSVGKMCLGIYIIDRTTGKRAQTRQFITRILTIDLIIVNFSLISCATFGSHASYMYAFLTSLYLGYILNDSRHRALHDIISNTMVVQNNKKHVDQTVTVV